MHDSFSILPAGTIRLTGPLGKALDLVIAKRLLPLDYGQLVEPFRQRNEDDGYWRCEFWGKVTRAAVYAWHSTGDSALKTLLDETVSALLATQTPDGCISSYPAGKQLSGWDLWGRKYVLVCLLDYYKIANPDPLVLEAMVRMVKQLIRQAGPRLQDYGEHFGMAAASILRALVELHQLSGETCFLESAEQLADAGCTYLHNIFRMAQLGVQPAELSDGKAYEMTSCFQGLEAFYRLKGNPEALEALTNYYRGVRDREITITGVGGLKDANGEFWFNGSERQLRHDCGGAGETCVTVSWLAFCGTLLQITGDADIADTMERSFYNALLGALCPDGTNFIHINPFLDIPDFKRQAKTQIRNFEGHDCCRAQGPYGLAMAHLTAVMQSGSGYVINCYEDLTAAGILAVSGGYPAREEVIITLQKAGDYELRLRAPRDFDSYCDGVKMARDSYHTLRRCWQPGDTVRLHFDCGMRTVERENRRARLCGPLVMCRETGRDPRFPGLRQSGEWVDYATAGAAFAAENTLQVWE